jgi:3-oxoacyl-[acyl-carrier protein] reductase
MGRFGTPEEAADLILDLAVHHPYLTGQIVTMDGAWT